MTDPRPDPEELKSTLSDLVQVTHRLTRMAALATGSTESPATWRTLSVLETHGPMRLGRLAAHSRVSQPTMTKIAQGLVEAGRIRRADDPEDARAARLAVTAEGLRALAGWRGLLADALLPIFADLDPADADTLRRTVEIVAARTELPDAAEAANKEGTTRA